jgi:hypothetical protein
MGVCEPFLSLFGSSNLVFTLDFDLTSYKTLSTGICASSSPNFLDVELPSDEAILESMIMDF